MSAKTLKAAGTTRKQKPKAERTAEASNLAFTEAQALMRTAEAEAKAEQAEVIAEAAETMEAEAEVIEAAETIQSEIAAEAEAEAADSAKAEAEALEAKAKAEADESAAKAALESAAKAAQRTAYRAEVEALRLIAGNIRQSAMQADSAAILSAADSAAEARKTLKEESAVYKNSVDVLLSWYFAFALSIAGTESEKRVERFKKARAKTIVAIGISPDNKKGSAYNAIRARIDYYGKRLLLSTVDPRSSLTDDTTVESWITQAPKIWEAIQTEIKTAEAEAAKAAEAEAAEAAEAIEAMKAELQRFRNIGKAV